MQKAEAAFQQRTQQDVYFGVGTYGSASDPQRGLGACYRVRVEGVDKDLLLQSVNTGSDVSNYQFDLQVGDGGAGAFNTCAGAPFSMYPGTYAPWGKQYGGADNRSQCAGLPMYPQVAGPMKAAGDSLVSLCEYSFDKGVRHEGGGNPTILDLSRVACPSELVAFTQLQRADDPSTFQLGEYRQDTPEFAGLSASQVAPQCTGPSLANCLTRMMDCRKPSGGFIDNIQSKLVVDGMRVVQPCLSDGYTRLDVQCGCMDCYC